jgi:TonB family protein
MTEQALQLLLRLNLVASAAILLVLILRRPVRAAFGPFTAYALWLAVPLCVAASFLPAPPMFKHLEPVAAFTWEATRRDIEPIRQAALDVAGFLLALWVAGALATAAVFAVRQARYVRSLGRLTMTAGDRRVLRAEHADVGPVVLGTLWPRIVVPTDFETRFDAAAQTLILAHERVHLARGDAALNGLVAFLQCLAWFNPLIHLAAVRLRADQEIACDAVVISRHPRARRAYAEALLDTMLVQRTVPFGCHWPPSETAALKERLVMLNVATASWPRRAVGLGLVGLTGLACASAVWAATPGSAPRVIGEPIWLEKPTGRDLAAVYPAKALAERLSGEVTIGCRVGRDGRLADCAVRSEAPIGAGFGEATLAMSRRFRMAARSETGQPTAGARVVIPVLFRGPE